MDTLLMSVTVMSLAMASALALLVLKLLRDERRRSDARVAVLTSLAGQPAVPDVHAFVPASPPPVSPSSRYARRPAVNPTSAGVSNRDLPLRSEPAPVNGIGELFATPDTPSRWRARSVAGVGLASVVVALVFLLSWAAREQPPVPATTAAPAAAPGAPLELLALTHTQSGGQFTISGVIANGREAGTLSHLTAVATALGADGTVVSSGRAAVDFTTLQPGDESPFVITLAPQAEIARYRVGFRAEDGTPIGHVDRRQEK